MRVFLKIVTTALTLVVVLSSFSYVFFRLSPMGKFANIVTMTVILLIPLISFSYVCFRLSARRGKLINLFTLPGILQAYLASKGRDVKPKGNERENDENHLARLKKELDQIFKTEFSREYGRIQYAFASLIGSASSGLVIYHLANSSLGRVLIGASNILPSPIEFALLGAFAWSVWQLLTRYDSLDLVPSTFYLMPFRYIVAIITGLLASTIFKNGIAIVFALVSTAVPYPELLNYLRTQILKQEPSQPGGPSLWKIQGMEQSTVYRLEELGIHTTQELAYFDPLELLFRSSFSPKVVIDWIDQSLAYNYVGESINELRKRGIRGSIELMHAKEKHEFNERIANVLGTTKTEVEYLIDRLENDYQVQLLSNIWDAVKVESVK